MPSGSIILATVLIAFAGIACFVCWIALLVRTFRESILWGILTFFFPIVGFIFMLLHWEENKRLFVAYLGSSLLCIAAILSVVPFPTLMQVIAHGRAGGGNIKLQRPFPIPARTSTSGTSVQTPATGPKLTPLEKAIQQKRLELQELYGSLDQWAKRLLVKRTHLQTATPEEVKAFNDEYAGYQAALKDYKSQSAQVEQLQADRLLEVKGGGKGKANPPKAK